MTSEWGEKPNDGGVNTVIWLLAVVAGLIPFRLYQKRVREERQIRVKLASGSPVQWSSTKCFPNGRHVRSSRLL